MQLFLQQKPNTQKFNWHGNHLNEYANETIRTTYYILTELLWIKGGDRDRKRASFFLKLPLLLQPCMPHFSLCNKRDTHPVLYCSWQVITRAHLHFLGGRYWGSRRKSVSHRLNKAPCASSLGEKLHFLTGKNDGKVSLRGYMHTNWPQGLILLSFVS